MKWYQSVWFWVWVTTLVFGSFFGVITYYEAYDVGYSQGYSDTPRNVVGISSLEITKENGIYHLTVISGNTTFTAIEIPNKTDSFRVKP